jgi:hypothetical protein
MTLHSLETLKDWLSDESQFHGKEPCEADISGFAFFVVRKRFRLRNGKEISIQQSAGCYCTSDSVEMYCCQHSLLIEPYDVSGEAVGPYALVPLHVVVDYLNEQENL